MKTMTISLTRTVAQSRDAAMREAGLSPRVMAVRPGTRRFENRKSRAARGHVKHKSQQWA